MVELRAARILVLPLPHILGRGPIVPPYEPRYMPTPLCPLGGWESFAQTQGPSQDLGYILDTSGGVGPSTNSLAGNGGDDDVKQYFRDDNSQ